MCAVHGTDEVSFPGIDTCSGPSRLSFGVPRVLWLVLCEVCVVALPSRCRRRRREQVERVVDIDAEISPYTIWWTHTCQFHCLEGMVLVGAQAMVRSNCRDASPTVKTLQLS